MLGGNFIICISLSLIQNDSSSQGHAVWENGHLVAQCPPRLFERWWWAVTVLLTDVLNGCFVRSQKMHSHRLTEWHQIMLQFHSRPACLLQSSTEPSKDSLQEVSQFSSFTEKKYCSLEWIVYEPYKTSPNRPIRSSSNIPSRFVGIYKHKGHDIGLELIRDDKGQRWEFKLAATPAGIKSAVSSCETSGRKIKALRGIIQE